MDSINFAIIAPILIISFLLAFIALVDLIKRTQTNGPKIVWVLIILFINTIGPVVYFIFGRKEA